MRNVLKKNMNRSNTKIEGKLKGFNNTYTNFIPEIQEWFDDRIKLGKTKQVKKQKGSFYNERSRSTARKKEMVEQVILPSLFNLTVFFENIQKDKGMRKLFLKDFTKIVGMTGMEEIKESKSMSDVLDDFKYEENNFSKLIIAMIKSIEPNFELKLDVKILYAFLYQLQDITGRTASIHMISQYGTESKFSEDSTNTFLKSIDLLAAMSTGYKDNVES